MPIRNSDRDLKSFHVLTWFRCSMGRQQQKNHHHQHPDIDYPFCAPPLPHPSWTHSIHLHSILSTLCKHIHSFQPATFPSSPNLSHHITNPVSLSLSLSCTLIQRPIVILSSLHSPSPWCGVVWFRAPLLLARHLTGSSATIVLLWLHTIQFLSVQFFPCMQRCTKPRTRREQAISLLLWFGLFAAWIVDLHFFYPTFAPPRPNEIIPLWFWINIPTTTTTTTTSLGKNLFWSSEEVWLKHQLFIVHNRHLNRCDCEYTLITALQYTMRQISNGFLNVIKRGSGKNFLQCIQCV